MEDFTGGVTEMHEMDKVDMSFFKTLQNSFSRGSLMGASIEVRVAAILRPLISTQTDTR